MSGIVDVAALDIRLASHEWRFAAEHEARIDAHWHRLRANKPRLFDGRVLLSRSLAVESGGDLTGTAFETGFKPFVCWRDFGFPDRDVYNCFAMPALRAADGAFVLGEMSATTANAGKLYFPAGTPEPSDAGPDGRVDFTANILRELAEETGLARSEVALDPEWTIVFAAQRVACMRITRTTLSVETLQQRLAAFNADQDSPELARLVAIRGPNDITAQMPDFMVRYLAHAFERSS